MCSLVPVISKLKCTRLIPRFSAVRRFGRRALSALWADRDIRSTTQAVDFEALIAASARKRCWSQYLCPHAASRLMGTTKLEAGRARQIPPHGTSSQLPNPVFVRRLSLQPLPNACVELMLLWCPCDDGQSRPHPTTFFDQAIQLRQLDRLYFGN